MGILKDVPNEGAKPDLKLDMERIYVDHPEFYGKELIDRHIKRYEWALTHLKPDDNVLDLCCGSGYGSNIIAGECKNVVALDKCDDAIYYAEKNYKKDNLRFQIADLTNLDFLVFIRNIKYPIQYNAVTWIEGIEHFKEKQTIEILKTIKAIIPVNGRLLISTPDKEQSDGKNEFHIKEYTAYELKSLINKYFKVIDIEIKDKFIYLVAEQNG